MLLFALLCAITSRLTVFGQDSPSVPAIAFGSASVPASAFAGLSQPAFPSVPAASATESASAFLSSVFNGGDAAGAQLSPRRSYMAVARSNPFLLPTSSAWPIPVFPLVPSQVPAASSSAALVSAAAPSILSPPASSTAFASVPSRFVQTLRAILRLQSAIANAASDSLSLEDSAPVVFPLHPSHHPHQRLATPTVSSSLMTLLERWFSATSSTEQRQLVDWPTAWSKTEKSD